LPAILEFLRFEDGEKEKIVDHEGVKGSDDSSEKSAERILRAG
jgi:hypothetical protein